MEKEAPRRRHVIKKRILTALVALPLLILFILFANLQLFGLFVTAATALALGEYFSMSLPKGRALERALALVAGALLVPVFASHQADAITGALCLLTLFFSTLFLFRFRDLTTVVRQLSVVGFGFLYLPLLLSHLLLLRGLPHGREWIFLVLLIVMAGDTAAYFIGSAFGRRKLYPAISPNKSVEGALGGLAGSLCGALLARALFFPALGIMDAVLLGLGLGALGQLGDLFESMLKRSFGVKDSGALIPGHGGILDRLDSLLFAFAPAYYYAITVFAG